MPAGIQVWNAAGDLIYDTAENLVKIFGIATVGGVGSPTSGTIVDSRFAMANHVPMYSIIKGNSWNINTSLQLSVSGTTLTWNFPGGSTTPTTFIYGVV